VLRKTTVLFVLAVLAWRLATADDKGDTSEPRQRIESLEQRLNEERARAQKERQAAEERLRALEKQIDDLRTKSEAAPAPPATAAAAPSLPSFPGILNPAIAADLNFVFRGSNQKMFAENGKRIDNQPNLREAEIDMRSAVGRRADAVKQLVASWKRSEGTLQWRSQTHRFE
jgi:hypothetical protein